MSLCIGKKPPHRVAAAEAEAAAHEPDQQKRTLGRTGSMLGIVCKDVKDDYRLGKKIGEGTFAVTYICKEKKTGKKYACKQIAKKKIVTKGQKEDLKREVIIMEHVSGHENFVDLKDVYEDDRYVNLVMENCEGGELFREMISKGRFSEKVAAQILCSIMKVVYCLHEMGIMHRDLKPENFLLLKKAASPCFADYTKLKAIDFGLSAYIDDEDHQWLTNNGVAIEKPTETLIPKMRYFRSMRKFKKLALKILMDKAPPEDFDRLRAIFKNLDTKEAKVIPREKLEKSLVRYGSHLPEEDVKLIVEAVRADTDGDGNIDFDEFLTAMRNFNQHKEEYLREAFNHFDKDLDGYISKEELKEALKDSEIDDIDVILSGIDINNIMDGKISYEEFCAMMTS
ncbi:hypothetical protein M8C21_007973 [Ambrosia artemisiifolia]|uniref:Uncharacterized protein n=1 Tax=Ambrosia artemisiifolia TaxID=4212 RepID=A0AAD5C6V7_AMBAR|nr:hypothetical protein M8C21_007973 [Ambrosia artemisiifolia]